MSSPLEFEELESLLSLSPSWSPGGPAAPSGMGAGGTTSHKMRSNVSEIGSGLSLPGLSCLGVTAASHSQTNTVQMLERILL